MDFLIPIIKVIHIVVSVILILIILLQPSKSGDLGSVFGGGTSESVFGASGAVPFLAKLTRLLAVVFFITSLSLGYFSVQSISSSVVTDTPQIEEALTPEEGVSNTVNQADSENQNLNQDSQDNVPGLSPGVIEEPVESQADPSGDNNN